MFGAADVPAAPVATAEAPRPKLPLPSLPPPGAEAAGGSATEVGVGGVAAAKVEETGTLPLPRLPGPCFRCLGLRCRWLLAAV